MQLFPISLVILSYFFIHLIFSSYFSLSVSGYGVQQYLSLADRTVVLAASLYGLVAPGSTSLSLVHSSCHATGAQPVFLVPTDSFPLPLSSKPSHTPLSPSACMHTLLKSTAELSMLSLALLNVQRIFFFFTCSSSVFSVFLFHEDPCRLMPSLLDICYNMHLPQEGGVDFLDCIGLVLWLCGDLVLLLNTVQQEESGKENRAGVVIF